ncbi:FCD domain-containing protein, partial [Salmonella enterica]|uniref:FCD domain-containing protein n=1 Tax=Salmonella enterica TaxID=28901 RepID=UPI003CED66E6
QALKLAIPNMAEEDFDLAADILRSYEVEPLPRRWSEMNERFHFALYAPCQRPRLMAMIQQTWSQVGRFTRMQVSMAAGKER